MHKMALGAAACGLEERPLRGFEERSTCGAPSLEAKNSYLYSFFFKARRAAPQCEARSSSPLTAERTLLTLYL